MFTNCWLIQVWISLNIVALLLEMSAKSLYTVDFVRQAREKTISDVNFRRILAPLHIVPFAFGLYSNIYFLGGSETGASFVRRIYDEETVTLRYVPVASLPYAVKLKASRSFCNFVYFIGCQLYFHEISSSLRLKNSHREEGRNAWPSLTPPPSPLWPIGDIREETIHHSLIRDQSYEGTWEADQRVETGREIFMNLSHSPNKLRIRIKTCGSQLLSGMFLELLVSTESREDTLSLFWSAVSRVVAVFAHAGTLRLQFVRKRRVSPIFAADAPLAYVPESSPYR